MRHGEVKIMIIQAAGKLQANYFDEMAKKEDVGTGLAVMIAMISVLQGCSA